MKKIILSLLLLVSGLIHASEIVKIYSPYSPGHSATPALYKILDIANVNQNSYKFILEFKPGGNQIIAVKSLDENNLAIIAPAFVENIETGRLQEEDYIPIYALGDACWAVIANKPLSAQKEFVVGGVGFGNAAHLTALALGEKYNFDVRYIVFKSNNDALINMAGNNGVEFVIDRYESYENLISKNKNMKMIAASCPIRLPQAPDVKTLKELGITAPYIFNIIVSHRQMPEARRRDIGIILHNATKQLGEKEVFELSAIRPPQFDNIKVEEFYTSSVNQVKKLQKKFRQEINRSQGK
jgi:hypothetical protein